tara:strand:+ start:3043 stop:3327 length:285 start_codon:yes stop_codon:yes gene_type:complete
MVLDQKIIDTVVAVIKHELGEVELLTVNIADGCDHDGEAILRVEIVFEAQGKRLDADRVVGLARHLRDPLAKLNETRFPVFTFKSGAEYYGEAA